MLDVKWIRDNSDAFVAGLEKRGYEPPPAKLLSSLILGLDQQRRATI